LLEIEISAWTPPKLHSIDGMPPDAIELPTRQQSASAAWRR
jgi:hypothetical protein